MCWGKRAGKWGLRGLIPLLSKISTDEANFHLIRNITQPQWRPRSTRHAHRIKVFCCLMIFCIALKVFVQGYVSAHEKILIFGSITSLCTRKRCSVSQRDGPLTWPLREYKYYSVLQMGEIRVFCLTVNIFRTILSGLAILTPQRRAFFFVTDIYFK